MLLLSTLLAELNLGLLAFLLGAIVGRGLDWLSAPDRWMPSQLPPACSADNSTYDARVDGWWFDDPCPGDYWQRGLTTRQTSEGVRQVLLPHELVVRQDLQVWEWIERYRD